MQKYNLFPNYQNIFSFFCTGKSHNTVNQRCTGRKFFPWGRDTGRQMARGRAGRDRFWGEKRGLARKIHEKPTQRTGRQLHRHGNGWEKARGGGRAGGARVADAPPDAHSTCPTRILHVSSPYPPRIWFDCGPVQTRKRSMGGHILLTGTTKRFLTNGKHWFSVVNITHN